jgi:hypothetical protein
MDNLFWGNRSLHFPVKGLLTRSLSSAALTSINFFSENYSGDVNINSGPGLFYSPFGPGIDIHIIPESVFTSPRNEYSHAPESAFLQDISRNEIIALD